MQNETFGAFSSRLVFIFFIILFKYLLGARNALQSFIRTETQRHYDQIAEDAVIQLIDNETDPDITHFCSVISDFLRLNFNPFRVKLLMELLMKSRNSIPTSNT